MRNRVSISLKSTLWVLTVLAIAAMSFLFLHRIASGDFFHHINSGRYIVEQTALPRVDTSTFTAYGKPWVDHSWGSGLIYYLVYRIAGLGGVSVLFAVFATVMLACVFRLLRQIGNTRAVALSITWLVAATLSLYWPARPLVMGPVLLAILLYILARYNEKYFRWFLPLFFWCWALLYGASSLLGLVVLGLFVLVYRKFKLTDMAIIVLSVTLSLLNGYGADSLLYLIRIPAMIHLQEWQSVLVLFGLPLLTTTKYRLAAYAVLCLVTITAWAIALTHRECSKQHIFYGLLSLGVALPLVSFRMLVLVPVLVAPFLGIVLRGDIKTAHKAVSLVCIAALLCTIAQFFMLGFPSMGFDNKAFPVEAVTALKRSGINGNIFAAQAWGAYISWELPQSKIFFDTRDELYQQTEVFKDDDLLYQGKISISTVLDKYGADVVIGSVANPLYNTLFGSDSWKLVYKNERIFSLVRSR